MRTLDPVRNYGQLLLTGAAPKGLPKDARRALPILDDFYEGRVSKLQMDRVDPRAFDKTVSKSERRKLRQTEVIWCVDKEGHRAVVPVSLHRPFPEGYSVAEMRLCWKKEAGKTKWSVQFVLKNDHFIPDKHESRLACGIDIGWRVEGDGSLLTATVIGSDGMPDWHLLPSHWTGGMDQMERLKSHADEVTLKMANEWWERLDQLPADLLPAFEKWTPKKAANKVDTALLRSQIKKRMLQAKESGVRVEDSGFPESLIWWYKEYNHLMIWHDNKREKLRRDRKQEYIKFARYLCERYAIIGIEKFNLSNVAKVKVKPGQKENNLSEKSRANRVRVAQYEFRQVLANTASKFGTEIVEVAGASTQQCHKCGHKNVHTVGSGERSFECRKCGAVWDRDLNAAQNICDAVTGKLQEKAVHSTQTFRYPESSLAVCASA